MIKTENLNNILIEGVLPKHKIC